MKINTLFFLFFIFGQMTLCAQQIDSNLLSTVLSTITQHESIAFHTLSMTRIDAINGCTKFGNSCNELGLDSSVGYSNQQFLVMLDKGDSQWNQAIQSLGAKRTGIIDFDDYKLYYMPYSFFWHTATPFVIRIQKTTYTTSKYRLTLETTQTPWKSFQLQNPPTHFYRFKLIFRKRNDVWQLKRVKKKRLAPFTQNQ